MNYKQGLKRVLEMNVAGGPGGMFGYGGGGGEIGTKGGAVGNNDWYASGDARVPSILGMGEPPKKKGKGKKKKSKKGERAKKTESIPMYRRAFMESLYQDALDVERPLQCVLCSDRDDYRQIIEDMLNTLQIPHLVEENYIVIQGSDERIRKLLEQIHSVITDEPFVDGDVVALIGEMDVKEGQLAGIAKGKTVTDFRNKHAPDTNLTDFIRILVDRIKQGAEVEKEHTPDVKIAKTIALDHIWEDLDYYDKLAKMEGEE